MENVHKIETKLVAHGFVHKVTEYTVKETVAGILGFYDKAGNYVSSLDPDYLGKPELTIVSASDVIEIDSYCYHYDTQATYKNHVKLIRKELKNRVKNLRELQSASAKEVTTFIRE